MAEAQTWQHERSKAISQREATYEKAPPAAWASQEGGCGLYTTQPFGICPQVLATDVFRSSVSRS